MGKKVKFGSAVSVQQIPEPPNGRYSFTYTGSVYSREAISQEGLWPDNLDQALKWIKMIEQNIAEYFQSGPGTDAHFGRARLEELTSYAEALRIKRDAP